MHAPTAVRATGVSRWYGDVVALDGVDLEVLPGQVHGLVGPNGAGKTTLLALLLGLSVADAGELEVLGHRVGAARAVPAGVAGFVDGPALYPTLTARANLAAVGSLSGRRATSTELDEALEQVGLLAVGGDRVAGFSLGMRQRLGLAAALLTRPRLLVLDEPANGLDPAGSALVREVVAGLAGAGTAVVLSSHRMDDLTALCSRVSILAGGRVVFSGEIEELAGRTDDLDYRVVTTDADRAHRVAAATPGLRVLDRDPAGALRVRGTTAGVDALVRGLLGAGVALRELAPTYSPLEAAFLELTGGHPDEHPHERPAEQPVEVGA